MDEYRLLLWWWNIAGPFIDILRTKLVWNVFVAVGVMTVAALTANLLATPQTNQQTSDGILTWPEQSVCVWFGGL